MEFQFKKHIKIVVDLEIGEEVTSNIKRKGGKHIIQDIKKTVGASESGFMAKISGYDGLVDIGWLEKIEK